MNDSRHEVILVRHGETAWSRSGQHTSRTDLPLTSYGESMAQLIGQRLHGRSFARVLVSPMLRARDTCRLAGLGGSAQVRPNLSEWDYGEYEGLTTPQIRALRPDWSLWDDGAPGGESPDQVGARADAVLAEARGTEGNVALFAHGHILRVIAARWLGSPAANGRFYMLSTASISVLGYERDQPVLAQWNDDSHRNP